MSEQFSAKPFYAGSVVGLRAFGVTTKPGPDRAVLLSPQVDHTWMPGENLAVCPDSCAVTFGEHPVGGGDGRCGFYAYFDGSNTYARRWRITGIVQGYGTVTVGHRGFKASKARIIALVRPELCSDMGCDCHSDDRQFVDTEVVARYPDVPWYDTEADAMAAHPLTNPADVGVEVPPESDGPKWRPFRSSGFAYGGRVVPAAMPVQGLAPYVQAMRDVAKAYERAARDVAAAFNRDASEVERALRQFGASMERRADEPTSPLERKRQLAEQRAKARAGLSGTGGFDRRGQRR